MKHPPPTGRALLRAALAFAVATSGADDRSAPLRTIHEVLAAPAAGERVTIRGVVTYTTTTGVFTVEDATGPAWIYAPTPRSPAPLPQPGDVVEVTGAHLREREASPQLFDAAWRITGRGPVPAARPVVLSEALSTANDGRRLRLQGRVLDFETFADGARKISRVWLQEGESVTYANYIADDFAPAPAHRGQLVEVEGVCIAIKATSRVVRSLAIQVQSMADVHPLPEPPPWRDPALRRWFLAGAALVAGAAAWVFLLRRQVRARTAQLAASEARHRLVVDTALDAVISLDAEGRIHAWNAQAGRTFGWAEKEVRGRSFIDTLLAPALRETQGRELAAALAQGEGQLLNQRLETMVRHRDGHEFSAELALAPLRAHGRVSYSAFLRDITARQQAEAELLRALERERELGRLKTNFVSTVSHEFRTPLEVILSSSDILERYLERLAPAERAEHLEAIQSSVKRMAALMEEVLVLGRLDAGRIPCRPDDLHLGIWCRRLVDELSSATAGRCPLACTLGDFDPMVRADESLLRHIFTNLLGNAVKYSPPGSPVHLAAARDGEDAVFTVTDHGTGIPAADLPHLFEAFHRGANVGQISGTGLGLVIVKRCVELHHGRVHVASTEGQGTTVTVRLPLFAAAAPAS